jgi:hypothetical protein
MLPIFTLTPSPVTPKFLPHKRATGIALSSVRVTDETSGAEYENARVRTPLCPDSDIVAESSPEIPDAILLTTEVPDICSVVDVTVKPITDDGL